MTGVKVPGSARKGGEVFAEIEIFAYRTKVGKPPAVICPARRPFASFPTLSEKMSCSAAELASGKLPAGTSGQLASQYGYTFPIHLLAVATLPQIDVNLSFALRPWSRPSKVSMITLTIRFLHIPGNLHRSIISRSRPSAGDLVRGTPCCRSRESVPYLSFDLHLILLVR